METEKKFFSKESLGGKAVIIGVLILLMLIPVSMVKSLISEREGNKDAEQTEMGWKWGGSQQLTGPVLVLPFSMDDEAKSKGLAYFLPDNYTVSGVIEPEERIRGIQTVLSYQSNMDVRGQFLFPDYTKLNLNPSQILWNEAYLILGISNLQGIKNKLIINVNGQPQEVSPGVGKNDIMDSGLTIKVNLDPADTKKVYDFDFKIILNGTDGLHFLPVGKQTSVNLKSVWKSVAYTGDFVPTENTDIENGIDAHWDVFDYNRNFTQMWIGANRNFNDLRLGVDLLLPVDHYQKTMRSAKYAILFISLTFLVFFMVELLSKKRIHPIQYLLVSFALVLFYCLLLAFSEHIGFAISYAVSAIAIVSLITLYSHTIFKSKIQTIYMGVFLSILYIFLYVVIQLEDMALLLGSVGLFIALATVMYVSRKVDWYKKEEK